jgi:hypothetical protein
MTCLAMLSKIHGVERGGEAACGLAKVPKTGLSLVLRRRVGGSFLGGGGRYCCSHPGSGAMSEGTL